MFSSSTVAKNTSFKHFNNTHGASNGNNNTTQPKDVKAHWESILRRHDADGDRRLGKKELKEAFKGAGSSMPRWRAYRALRRADKNGDGFIEETEFSDLIKYAREKDFVL